MDAEKEAGKLAIFGAVVAAMAWITGKAKDTWWQWLFFKAENKGDKK